MKTLFYSCIVEQIISRTSNSKINYFTIDHNADQLTSAEFREQESIGGPWVS